MQDITGFGMRVILTASKTFPAGITITQFADDADPFDSPAMAIAEKAMGLNGDLIVWSKATPIDVTINIIPGTEDARNLDALVEANRISRGKTSARDVITMVRIMPDGKSDTLTNGALTNAVLAAGIASAGRGKTQAYQFTFENKAAS